MVRRGEYLERAVVVPHGAATLDGLYHRGRTPPALLMVPPSPDEGSMEIPVVAEVAWAAARAGHPTLRFNYPGVGASPGAFSEAAADAAVPSAIAHVELCGVNRVAALGVGWGGRPLARHLLETAWQPAIVVLVQPPLDLWANLGRCRVPIRAFFPEEAEAEVAAATEAAAGLPDAAVTPIPRADARFRAGLVHLGQAVVKALAASRPPEDPGAQDDRRAGLRRLAALAGDD